jgi:LPXTG-motif cell wall-anchored protein
MIVKFFTATYCAPCAQIKPQVEAMARQAGHTFVEVDVQTTMGRDEAQSYGFTVTPSVAVLDGQKVVATFADGASQISTELPKLLETKKEDGNTLYYIVGGALLLGAAVYLGSRKKKGSISGGRTSQKQVQNHFLSDMRRINKLKQAHSRTSSAVQKRSISQEIKKLKKKYNMK